MKKVMTAAETMEMIPNRYPICYVDYVGEIIPNEKIITTKNATVNEESFQGHFPGNPTMLGVLTIEALIQMGSVLILEMGQFEDETVCIDGINKAEFRQKVVPGGVLKLHFGIVKLRDFVGIGRATTHMEDKKVCKCKLTLIVGR